jgi:predicted dehydrogenase
MSIKGIICGTGRAGTYLHFGALTNAGAQILAFVDIDAESAQRAAARYRVPHSYASLEEALAVHKDVDFVDICTNVDSHLDLAKCALVHGANVLMEKPLTKTVEEAEHLKALKSKYDKVLCAVHNHKYYPGMQMLRRMVTEGALGELVTIHRELMFNHETVRMMEPEHWAHQIPGGRLFEANPHNLYLLYGLVGEMELVTIIPRKVSNYWEHAKIDGFHAVLQAGATTISLRMGMQATVKGYGKHGPNFFLVVGTRKTVIADYNQVIEFESAGHSVRNLGLTRLGAAVRRKLFAFRNRPTRDTAGEVINTGKGSGHYWLADRFVGHLDGRYAEEAVPFAEAFYVQRMNSYMGETVDRLMPDG